MTAAILLAAAAAVSAQSLVDLARTEEARRKAVKTSGKVYTNDTLRPEPAAPAPPTAAPPSTAEKSATAPTTGAAATSKPTGPDTPAAKAPANEADWRKRIADARSALSRSQVFADALQSRINVLSADFVNRDDPAQRDLVGAERQKALAELDRVKLEIQQFQKAIVAIQEEARRAGVPAGWVR